MFLHVHLLLIRVWNETNRCTIEMLNKLTSNQIQIHKTYILLSSSSLSSGVCEYKWFKKSVNKQLQPSVLWAIKTPVFK